jgi:hypothetical protein
MEACRTSCRVDSQPSLRLPAVGLGHGDHGPRAPVSHRCLRLDQRAQSVKDDSPVLGPMRCSTAMYDQQIFEAARFARTRPRVTDFSAAHVVSNHCVAATVAALSTPVTVHAVRHALALGVPKMQQHLQID